MTELPAGHVPSTSRFPGFDVMSQLPHWDEVTARVVRERLVPAPDRRFFDREEFSTVTLLVSHLLDLDPQTSSVLSYAVDARLAARRVDGWRYESMPEDPTAWRRSVLSLDEDARRSGGRSFAELGESTRHELLRAVQELGSADWHGMPASRIWDLWLRYACTAYYARPDAWNEIGFPGPAYPRGYKNLGIDAREPFEVADAEPDEDPVRDPGVPS